MKIENILPEYAEYKTLSDWPDKCIISKRCQNHRGHCVVKYGSTAKSVHIITFHAYNDNSFIHDDVVIHHICEHKTCVNPKHLIQERRAVHSSFHNSGEGNPQSKLTNEIVRFIRDNTDIGKTVLMEMFNISRAQLNNIIAYRSWRLV